MPFGGAEEHKFTLAAIVAFHFLVGGCMLCAFGEGKHILSWKAQKIPLFMIYLSAAMAQNQSPNAPTPTAHGDSGLRSESFHNSNLSATSLKGTVTTFTKTTRPRN